jgi:Ni,Fe-hydrogenase I cytochrome b subunit
MAFQNKNLSVIAYANGFTLWHYAAAETLATIAATGYFNSVRTLMNIGDIVIVNASDSTSIKKINMTSGNVTTGALA